jgi:hypothetical protein
MNTEQLFIDKGFVRQKDGTWSKRRPAAAAFANDDSPAPANLAQVEVEAELHDDIMNWCKERGWKAFHGSMAHRSRRTAGEADFTICAPHGRVFFIECKKRGAKQSPDQLAVAAHLRKLGHDYHVVRSMAEFEEVVRVK